MDRSINQRIALYRKMANLTQIEVAEKMGMKCSTYSQMERKGSISTERLLVLADILGVTPEMLLYDTPAANQFDFSAAEAVTNSLNQRSDPFSPAPFIPTHKEESIIKILRNLPKSYYDEVVRFIDQKYKDSKKK